ncbi:hypothetical protein MMPV_003545 [Pyropia vietnamensis]
MVPLSVTPRPAATARSVDVDRGGVPVLRCDYLVLLEDASAPAVESATMDATWQTRSPGATTSPPGVRSTISATAAAISPFGAVARTHQEEAKHSRSLVAPHDAHPPPVGPPRVHLLRLAAAACLALPAFAAPPVSAATSHGALVSRRGDGGGGGGGRRCRSTAAVGGGKRVRPRRAVATLPWGGPNTISLAPDGQPGRWRRAPIAKAAADGPPPSPPPPRLPPDAPVPAPPPDGGLMTDSVLEVKWRLERNRQAAAAAAAVLRGAGAAGGGGPGAPLPPLSAVDAPEDGVGGAAFVMTPEMEATRSRFPAIAAPTASLGRDLGGGGVPLVGGGGVPPRDGCEDCSEGGGKGRPGQGNGGAVPSASATTTGGGVAAAPPVVADADVNSTAHRPPSPLSSAATAAAAVAASPYSAGALVTRMYAHAAARRNMAEFLGWFAGDFDNYEQVLEERAAGLFPREGGGHEHIHCTLTPLGDGWLFAKYYFNGDPSVVFRSRLYRVTPVAGSPVGLLEMRIYRLFAEAEAALRAAAYDVRGLSFTDADVYDWLQGCEVYWERYQPPAEGGSGGVPASLPVATTTNAAASATPSTPTTASSAVVSASLSATATATTTSASAATSAAVATPTSTAAIPSVEHDSAAALGIHPGPRYVGWMQGGGCTVHSAETGGRIHILDDLLLTPTDLWVNDRGFGEGGGQVYGNRRGEAYQMRRVVPGGALDWTLHAGVPEPPVEGGMGVTSLGGQETGRHEDGQRVDLVW